VTALELDSLVKTVTKDMLLVLIRYYNSILRFLFLEDESSFPECFDASFFSKSNISQHVQQLHGKGATERELALFSQIEKIFSNKSTPNKSTVLKLFKDMRLMLTSEIDNIITTVARTALEESEKCVMVGTVEACWDPWSQRLKNAATYMTIMEKAPYKAVNNSDENSQLQLLSSIYDKHVNSLQGREVEALSCKILDSVVISTSKTKSISKFPTKIKK